MDRFNNEKLDNIAKAINPRVKRWVGIKAGSNKRRYICRICDTIIDTEAADWRMTRHAEKNILAHMEHHLKRI